MTDLFRAILLGIIQGLTEFLPVSSSGHIELFRHFIGFEPEDSLLFTVVVHFATALSTVFVFRKDILDIIKNLGNRSGQQFALFIALSMIPAALAGVFLDEWISTLFEGRIAMVSVFLIFTGMLLFLTDRAGKTAGDLSAGKAILIGIAQAIAILPGISRSGATIATSVLLNIERQKAARFSFLMVVPLIFGKMAKDLLDSNGTLFDGSGSSELIAGFIAAFITGYLACTWMIKLVVGSRLRYFGFYCLGIGTIALVFTLFIA
jgi:undecaprenyl-diphosphatase